MDEDVDKDAIGHELAACIAEAQALRTARLSDSDPDDFPRLKEWQAIFGAATRNWRASFRSWSVSCRHGR